ncbi:chaplin [Streptomyces sp. ME02-8801-2C]|uniref:chaplin n=1 Tax=Streptomyces sp. ME02-8801-2C TaxID=3028680 RepID=UPI0039F72AD5
MQSGAREITPLAAQPGHAPAADTAPGIPAPGGYRRCRRCDSDAHGAAAHSPGVLSGNVLQVPVHMPVNVCGDAINVIGLLNPAFGHTCVND